MDRDRDFFDVCAKVSKLLNSGSLKVVDAGFHIRYLEAFFEHTDFHTCDYVREAISERFVRISKAPL